MFQILKQTMTSPFNTLRSFDSGSKSASFLHSLPALEEAGVGPISKLPISIRIVLESVLRNCDGKKVQARDVETLANWKAKAPAQEEIPFVVARIVLQDFTGVPLLVDLAAMRDAAIETADIALMQDDLVKIAETVRLGRRTMGIIRFNITFALGIKAVFLALTLLGHASLWLAIMADTGATLLVVANALRLLRKS